MVDTTHPPARADARHAQPRAASSETQLARSRVRHALPASTDNATPAGTRSVVEAAPIRPWLVHCSFSMLLPSASMEFDYLARHLAGMETRRSLASGHAAFSSSRRRPPARVSGGGCDGRLIFLKCSAVDRLSLVHVASLVWRCPRKLHPPAWLWRVAQPVGSARH